METKTTIKEKVKTVILEEIKTLADNAWCNPTNDNIRKMLDTVEYLKKVLEIDNYTSSISTWRQSPLTTIDSTWRDDNATARVRKSSDMDNNIFIGQKEYPPINNHGIVFNNKKVLL